MTPVILAFALASAANAQSDPGELTAMATLRVGPAMTVVNAPTVGFGGALGARVEFYHAAFYADFIGSLALSGTSALSVGGQIGTHYLWNGNTGRKQDMDTTPYFGGGLGYHLKLFTDPNDANNQWSGAGVEVHVSGGFEMMRLKALSRAFIQAEVSVPMYLVASTTGSSLIFAPVGMITVGYGYRPQ